MSGRQCYACGSLSAETAFPGFRKRRGEPDLCCDCLNDAPAEVSRRERMEARRQELLPGIKLRLAQLREGTRRVRYRRAQQVKVETNPVCRRARYRAALRRRARSPQLDMIDLVVRAP